MSRLLEGKNAIIYGGGVAGGEGHSKETASWI
jgi:hypothetical protein